LKLLRRRVASWGRGKQLLLVGVMLLLFPLAVVVGIVGYLIGVMLAGVGGFIIGPCFMADYCQCPTWLSIFLCPILMVMGAVAGLIGSVGYGCVLLHDFLALYCVIIRDVVRYQPVLNHI
jgi:hypothetical protein